MNKLIEDIMTYLFLVFQPKTLVKIVREYSDCLKTIEGAIEEIRSIKNTPQTSPHK